MEPRAVPLYPAECGDELLYRIWDVQYACQQLVAPDEPIPDRGETAAYLRSNPASERRWYWTVGDVDGFAEVSVTDGQSTAWLDLYVAPDARRRGAGRALLEAAAARAKEQGCKHLIGEYVEPGAAGFVRAVGAREGTDRLRYSVLRLPLRTGPVPDVPGYERVSWTGSAPEELLASYAQARNAINDAPHDDAVDEERYTPERVRDLEADAARRWRWTRPVPSWPTPRSRWPAPPAPAVSPGTPRSWPPTAGAAWRCGSRTAACAGSPRSAPT